MLGAVPVHCNAGSVNELHGVSSTDTAAHRRHLAVTAWRWRLGIVASSCFRCVIFTCTLHKNICNSATVTHFYSFLHCAVKLPIALSRAHGHSTPSTVNASALLQIASLTIMTEKCADSGEISAQVPSLHGTTCVECLQYNLCLRR